jgi:hypothetical protein
MSSANWRAQCNELVWYSWVIQFNSMVIPLETSYVALSLYRGNIAL